MARMNEEELLGKTLYVASESAKHLLKAHGTVLPFALTLDDQGDQVKTYFPRDQRPGAVWEELVEAAVLHLTRCIQSTQVGAIALATELVSGDQSGVGIQVETRSSSLFLIYPYLGTWRNRSMGEPGRAEGLLVGPILASKRAR